jgi:hypothetical protein
MATVVALGASWRNNSSRLVPSSLVMKTTPVKLAPGRLRLANTAGARAAKAAATAAAVVFATGSDPVRDGLVRSESRVALPVWGPNTNLVGKALFIGPAPGWKARS